MLFRSDESVPFCSKGVHEIFSIGSSIRGTGLLTLEMEVPPGAALQQRTALVASPRGGGGALTMERKEQVAAIACRLHLGFSAAALMEARDAGSGGDGSTVDASEAFAG